VFTHQSLQFKLSQRRCGSVS